jgi:outer membrane protein insertion porin family
VQEVEGSTNKVDLTFDLKEANLNQLTFGAGISQFDGFFGQLSYQTTNFMGRGETFTMGLQSGSRVKNYNVGFTEPFVFGRPISAGIQIFSRKIEWIGAYTQDSAGGSVTLGKPLTLFTRLFLTYSYEATRVTDINPFFFGDDGTPGNAASLLQGNPFLADSLLLNTGGRRTISKIGPSIRLNTVDHPIFPNRGHNMTVAVELAGLGGNTSFYKPTLEGTWYIPHTSRTTFGLRAQWIHLSAANPLQIPVFERLWLGGEYSVRGYDIRRIGPLMSDIDPAREPGSSPSAPVACSDPTGDECVGVSALSYQGRTIIGGNKSLLFNAEYQISIVGPVRLIAFYDAGQVQDFGRAFGFSDFKTSTGIELRFFMPMLNVPFRLIYAWNPQRDGVYNDQLLPQEDRTFRFAIGTTF